MLQVVNSLEVGGLERVVIDLLQHSNQKIYLQHLLCLEGRGGLFSEIESMNISTFVLDRTHASILKTLYEIRKIIKKNDIHIIHAHNVSPLFFSCLLKKVTKAKYSIIYTSHNYLKNLSKAQDSRFRIFSKCVDRFVTVSDQLKDFYEHHYQIKPIDVVYNGIPDPCLKTDPVTVSGYKKQYEGKRVIGTVANMTEQKGMPFLIESIPKVIERHGDAHFILVGDGPVLPKLKEMAAALHVEDFVTFAGRRLDAVNWMAMFDLFVLPSLWEGLPIVILEAIASKKPLVVTDVGGNSILVKNKENGFLVPAGNSTIFANAIIRMLDDKNRMAQMGMAGRRLFESGYTVSKMMENYASIYNEVLDGTRLH